MRIALTDLGFGDVLAGATNGMNALSQFVARVRGVTTPTVVYLDFSGISVATGSFLRESVLGFRAYCRRVQQNLCFIMANPNDLVCEELRDLLANRREAIVCCKLSDSGLPEDPHVEGVLEEKQLVTLDAVLAEGEADASSLAERFAATERISVTGWNNRLASLAQEGILVETRSGRVKRYRPVLEGLKRGA